MKTKSRVELKRAFYSLLLTAEICLIGDIAIAFIKNPPSRMWIPLIGAACFAVFFFVRAGEKKKRTAALVIPLILIAAALAALFLWRSFYAISAYQETDFGKEALYSGKNVMLVVPHEDDDQNILGGVLEQYIKYGSQIRVVFVTNGDFGYTGEERINEAVCVMDRLGVPEENLFFLGYGDQWDISGPHIYNAEMDEPMTSRAGFTHTYGTESHPAYHDGQLYTRRHLLEDLISVILKYEPDILIGPDFDQHIDHRAAGLFFDEAVGQVLAREPDYTPLVLKGFAYSTAYYSFDDFYQPNIFSTCNPTEDKENMEETNVYRWDERIRFPVDASVLSRSLKNAGTHNLMKLYASQEEFAMTQTSFMINGDKVFWLRDSTSLTYTAQIHVSSGQASRLNDFKLADSDDLVGQQTAKEKPFDGAWVPDADDTEKTAEVVLAESAGLAYICLYDNPSETDNVLDALIRFDDGSELHTGPLDRMGSATEIEVNKSGVRSFTVKLLKTEGERAGLTEIEAYSERHDWGLRYIKLQNEEEDFVYDYLINRSGTEEFTLYAVGCPEELNTENYTLSIQGEGCSAQMTDGKLRVECPRGKSCVVQITSTDGKVSDSAVFSNPARWKLWGQKIEQLIHDYTVQLKWTMSYRILHRIGIL